MCVCDCLGFELRKTTWLSAGLRGESNPKKCRIGNLTLHKWRVNLKTLVLEKAVLGTNGPEGRIYYLDEY